MERVRAGLVVLRSAAAGMRRVARANAQSMVEYAIIAALIAVVALAAVSHLGNGVCSAFETIAGRMATVENAAAGSAGGGGGAGGGTGGGGGGGC